MRHEYGGTRFKKFFRFHLLTDRRNEIFMLWKNDHRHHGKILYVGTVEYASVVV